MYPIQPLPPLVDVPYGGGPRLGTRYANPALFTSTRVMLLNELVGAIIGPRAIPSGNGGGGGGGGDRIITIEGTPEQISRAQAPLQQAVRQSGLWQP
ncbi:unnamed protein product [Rotaria sp. Silwood1]|nr:unnamed protein product [Rotaria sp. Silwood1]CAF1210166.1 unnamed protein product [Rotaria sp. Silwood1]CAF1233258.1 unnamed protein product [Rotaria sp. Silwood1]CAF3506844.1 unnamed protein product [Rotaria sp. Silwood1]CAF5043598.1 unnamed protein product [Rotaria sp. Silwood1]